MSRAFAFLRECGVFFVATVDGTSPAVRPFGAVMEYQGCLYLSTGAGKAVYAQMKKNPAVQIVALKGGTREWIRITGTAVETTDPEEKAAMLRECPALAKRYASPRDAVFALFRIEDMAALLCTDGGKIPLED